MNVAATFASVLPVVLFRSFPFAFSVCATRRATLPFRVSIITTFLAAIIIEFRFGRERLYDVAWVPVVYLYFLLVACGVYWLSGAVSRRAIRAGAVLFASALFFVVLPACVSHHALRDPLVCLLHWNLGFVA